MINRNHQKTINILNKMAKINNMSCIPENIAIINNNNINYDQKYNIFDLIRYESLRYITISSCLLMFFA